jgi:hypothetical protein
MLIFNCHGEFKRDEVLLPYPPPLLFKERGTQGVRLA